MESKIRKKGEYAIKDDYHKQIDAKWKYYPIYVEKMRHVDKIFSNIPKSAKILDIGCGEGVLVNKLKNEGYDIIGVDLNYASECIIMGNILKLPFRDDIFDYIVCLDVIEHLNFDEQTRAFCEIKRMLKNEGEFILSIPNLAHFASRISFTFTGKLIRTSSIDRHKGDRPINEYLHILNELQFKIISRKGIFPTFILSSVLTYLFPSKVLFLHKFLNKFLSYPNICFLNIIISKKR